MNRRIFGYVTAAAVLAMQLSACGTINDTLSSKSTSTEYFRVYDIKTSANVQTIAQAAANGIGKDINDMNESYPINTSGVIPKAPGYMKLVDPFSGSPMGAFAESAGSVGMKLAECTGAAWTSRSRKVVAGDDSETFDLCLFPYQGGYQLDIYGDLVTQSGGIDLPLLIARSVVNKALGSPKQFMDKAFADTLDSIHAALPSGAIVYVRGEPAPGPLPWISHTLVGK